MSAARLLRTCWQVIRFGNFVAPTLIPVLAWLGVYLIDDRLRALLPVWR